MENFKSQGTVTGRMRDSIPSHSPSVLFEAEQLVNGPRQATYGSPKTNWERTAKIWSVILGVPVTARQAALCMVGTKLAREVHKSQRDNLVDIAGYIGVVELIDKENELTPD